MTQQPSLTPTQRAELERLQELAKDNQKALEILAELEVELKPDDLPRFRLQTLGMIEAYDGL